MWTRGRLRATALTLAATVLALLAVSPGAAALGSLDVDAHVDLASTSESLDVAVGAAVDAAAAGVGESVEVAQDPEPLELPVDADVREELPEVERSLSHEIDASSWGPLADAPVDAEAAADARADTRDDGPDEVRTADDQLVTSSSGWTQEAAAVTTGLILAGLAAAFWTSLQSAAAKGLAVAAPLFTRLDREDVLSNGTRLAIYEAVQADPGLCTREIAERVDVAWGTTVYHLKVLEDHHYVTTLKHGRHRRYFENGGTHHGDKEALATLQNEKTAEVLATVRDEPGLPQKEIAERVDLTPQALAWHMKRLVELDLVEKQRDGRRMLHFVGDARVPVPA